MEGREFLPEQLPEQEKKEARTMKDVFGYDIDEIIESVKGNQEMDPARKMDALHGLSQCKLQLENSLKEHPGRTQELLEKFEKWYPGFDIELNKAQGKITDPELGRALAGSYTISQIEKFEESDPSQEMKDFVDEVIAHNGTVEFDELERLNNLKLNAREMEIVRDFARAEVEPRVYWGYASLIEEIRSGAFYYERRKEAWNDIFQDKAKVEEIKNNVTRIKEAYKDIGISVHARFDGLEGAKTGNVEKILASRDEAKKADEIFDLPKAEYLERVFEFADLNEDAKKEIFSEKFIAEVRDLRVSFGNFQELGKMQKILSSKRELVSARGPVIKDLISDFKIEKIDYSVFEGILELKDDEWKKISGKDLLDQDFRDKVEPLIAGSALKKEANRAWIDNIKKTKGDYSARNFSQDLLDYFSSSAVFSYLTVKDLEKANPGRLKELESENPEIFNKLRHNDLKLEDVIPGKKIVKKIVEPENIGYLLAAKRMGVAFDFYGFSGKKIDEIKKEVDIKAEKYLDNYGQNKEKLLPYISSVLGYASKYKEQTNEILDIEDLWDFKFSHLPELKAVVDEVKDYKMPIEKNKETETDRSKIYIENLKEHLREEDFDNAKNRIGLISEENREKILNVLDKISKITESLKGGKAPDKKDIDTVLSNKPSLKRLGLSLSVESIKEASRAIGGKEETKDKSLVSVEIIKTAEEHMSAMDMEPSCMRCGEKYDHGALTIAESPVLIIGAKDAAGRIKGRALLIPVKDREGKWRFELKNTYGAGSESIHDFAGKMEQILRDKKSEHYGKGSHMIGMDVMKGELPESKKTLFTKNLEFYRDGAGLVTLKEAGKEKK